MALPRSARLLLSVLLAALSFGAIVAPEEARAFALDVVQFDQSPCIAEPEGPNCFGTTVTVGLRASNEALLPIQTLSISARGNSTVGLFTGGSRVGQVLSAACIPGTGCLSGINASLFDDGVIDQVFFPDVHLQIFDGLNSNLAGSIVPGDGLDDPGLDGVLGGGDAQFLMNFIISDPGVEFMDIDVAYQIEGGAFVETTLWTVMFHSDAFATITAVPEPSVAAMLGGGLIGLGLGRSRKRA